MIDRNAELIALTMLLTGKPTCMRCGMLATHVVLLQEPGLFGTCNNKNETLCNTCLPSLDERGQGWTVVATRNYSYAKLATRFNRLLRDE
jgi:hypothetical protein